MIGSNLTGLSLAQEAVTRTWTAELISVAKNDVLPILGAFLILLIGYLVAKIVSSIVSKAFKKTSLDEKLAAAIDVSTTRIVGVASMATFWVVMLFVFIGFFNQLKFPMVSEPIQDALNTLTTYLLKMGFALALLFAAFVVATVVRTLLKKVLTRVALDEKFAKVEVEKASRVSLTRTISEAAYWLIFLIFLPGVLGTLGLSEMINPVSEMVGKITGFLPKILLAAVFFGVGYFVARIVQRVLTNLLAATGLNGLGEKVGLRERKLSDLIGLFVFISILIPILVSSLETLDIESISAPATKMIDQVVLTLPGIIGGLLVLAVFYFVGRLISGLVSELLSGVGFDNILSKIGLPGGRAREGKAPSDIVGLVIIFLFVFIGITEGLKLAGLESVSTLAEALLQSTFKILIGIVIFGIGLFLANFVSSMIVSTQARHADVLAFLARASILIIVGFMALNQTQLAPEVTASAFNALIYGVAIALAIAFGWAGKDTAAKLLRKLEDNLKLK